jgi:CDP-diacylglycerol--glycerol-3-phosphate 3-phosphatidyltransferase
MNRDHPLARVATQAARRLILPLLGRVHPDQVTRAGLILAAFAGAAFLVHPLAAGVLILLSGLADMMDGLAARNRNLASPQGAFMDSVLDRYGEAAMLLGVLLYFGRQPGLVVWAGPLVLLAFLGSMMVSYTRARGESLGVLVDEGLFARPERLILLAAASLLDFLWPPVILLGGVGILALGANLTAWMRFRRIRRLLANGDHPPGPSSQPAGKA